MKPSDVLDSDPEISFIDWVLELDDSKTYKVIIEEEITND